LDQNCDQLLDLIRCRAENLFETHQLLCSEAVLYVLNEGLRGGLPAQFAVRLASGFGEGIGKTGCMCGAFSGAVMGLGLFLGREGLNGKGANRILRKAREFYEQFKSEFGATCCRVLTKKNSHDQNAMFNQCKVQTGVAAEMAARIILQARPELMDGVNRSFLATQDAKFSTGLHRFLMLMKP
jgi:C_GCAxxG_C_C family probable redox protein